MNWVIWNEQWKVDLNTAIKKIVPKPEKKREELNAIFEGWPLYKQLNYITSIATVFLSFFVIATCLNSLMRLIRRQFFLFYPFQEILFNEHEVSMNKLGKNGNLILKNHHWSWFWRGELKKCNAIDGVRTENKESKWNQSLFISEIKIKGWARDSHCLLWWDHL